MTKTSLSNALKIMAAEEPDPEKRSVLIEVIEELAFFGHCNRDFIWRSNILMGIVATAEKRNCCIKDGTFHEVINAISIDNRKD